jgi:hypothetical protein
MTMTVVHNQTNYCRAAAAVGFLLQAVGSFLPEALSPPYQLFN